MTPTPHAEAVAIYTGTNCACHQLLAPPGQFLARYHVVATLDQRNGQGK